MTRSSVTCTLSYNKKSAPELSNWLTIDLVWQINAYMLGVLEMVLGTATCMLGRSGSDAVTSDWLPGSSSYE